LMVAPKGKTIPAVSERMFALFSTQSIVTGKVAELEAVEKAVPKATPIFLI
jgi:hypothetical protein